MGPRRKISAVLALTLAVSLFDEAHGETLAPYVESSGTEQRPRSNAGLSIHGRDWLQLRAGIALRATASPGDSTQLRPSGSFTEIVPNLRSTVSLAKNLAIETRVSFAEWNAGAGATADTRLRYRKSLNTFVDELDGSVWRSHDGLTKQSLRLGFNHLLGDPAAIAPFTISGAATFEATQSAAASPAEPSAGSHRVGLETRVTGLMSRFLATDHGLTFKAERTVGTRRESASVLAYDQAWTLGSATSLGFKLEFPRQSFSPADDFEPSVGIDWHGRF
jgi:hypothetical protein